MGPETIARSAASIAYDLIPAPFGEFAPPARQGLINIGTWFWVSPLVWQPKSVTAWVPSPIGPIVVTTTATPYRLIFDPGDGVFGSGKNLYRSRPQMELNDRRQCSITMHVHVSTLIGNQTKRIIRRQHVNRLAHYLANQSGRLWCHA